MHSSVLSQRGLAHLAFYIAFVIGPRRFRVSNLIQFQKAPPPPHPLTTFFISKIILMLSCFLFGLNLEWNELSLFVCVFPCCPLFPYWTCTVFFISIGIKTMPSKWAENYTTCCEFSFTWLDAFVGSKGIGIRVAENSVECFLDFRLNRKKRWWFVKWRRF